MLVFAGSGVVFATDAQLLESRLFESDEPLEITLTFDRELLCRNPRDRPCEDVAGTLSVQRTAGTTQVLPVSIRSRGDFRLRTENCYLPPLFIRFSSETTRGTVFEGQRILPLTLQCRTGRLKYRDYVLAEYLAYEIYTLLTPRSIRARLVLLRIQRKPGASESRQLSAFFTEHFDDVALRNGGTMVAATNLEPHSFEPSESTRHALFQYLVGNTDWSLLAGHNVVYFAGGGEYISPIPYDFDFAGIVNADYASVYPGLPIRRVSQRLFRGFCYSDLDWNGIYRDFEFRRPSIETLLRETPGLTSSTNRRVRNYVSRFYKIIADESQRKKNIEDACRR